MTQMPSTNTHTETGIYMGALFLMADTYTPQKSWKQPMWSSTGEWMSKQAMVRPHCRLLLSSKKEWPTDTCNKIDKSQTYDEKGKKSESKRSHTPKAKDYVIPCIWNSRKGKIIGPETQSMVAQGSGWERLTAEGNLGGWRDCHGFHRNDPER